MLRGDIYLVDFGKSKQSFAFGKKRPALIIQTNKLNFAVEENIYDYFLVAPLSTQQDIVSEEFRIEIQPQDGLTLKSYVVTNSICFLHKRFFEKKLTTLDSKSMEKVSQALKEVLELS